MKSLAKNLPNQSVLPKNQSGFTLIELLVVIAIIGLLASVVLVSLNATRVKARDVKRIADTAQLQKALDLYYDQNNVYPDGFVNNVPCGGWNVSSVDPFIPALKTAGIMSTVAVDPLNTGTGCGTYTYRYYRYPAGSYNCDPNKGAFYILGVNAFENTTPPGASPGFGCNIDYTTGPLSTICIGGGAYFTACRNWQTEFPWITGKLEK
jgi:prepilin-type N-terminal cleavage/methylation domain-containing protein